MKNKLNLNNKNVFIAILALLIFNTITCVHFIVSMEPQLDKNSAQIHGLEREIDILTIKINETIVTELEEVPND